MERSREAESAVREGGKAQTGKALGTDCTEEFGNQRTQRAREYATCVGTGEMGISRPLPCGDRLRRRLGWGGLRLGGRLLYLDLRGQRPHTWNCAGNLSRPVGRLL